MDSFFTARKLISHAMLHFPIIISPFIPVLCSRRRLIYNPKRRKFLDPCWIPNEQLTIGQMRCTIWIPLITFLIKLKTWPKQISHEIITSSHYFSYFRSRKETILQEVVHKKCYISGSNLARAIKICFKNFSPKIEEIYIKIFLMMLLIPCLFAFLVTQAAIIMSRISL